MNRYMNHRRLKLCNLITAVSLLVFSPNCGTDLEPSEPPSPGGVALDDLLAQSMNKPFLEFEKGIPVFMEGMVPIPAYVPENPVASALSYLDRYKDLYRLDEPASQLFLKRNTTDDSGDHLFFGQQRDGIVVDNAELAVHMRAGMVIGTNGRYLADVPPAPTPEVSEDAALGFAGAHAGIPDPKQAGVPLLVYFDSSLLGTGEPANPRLAWRVSIGETCEADRICPRATYIVDAMTGEILSAHSVQRNCGKNFDIDTANNTWSDSCFSGVFETQNDEWFEEDGPDCDFFNGCPNPDADGWAAYNLLHQVYDFFRDRYGRCGWDGRGGAIEVLVNVAFAGGPNSAYMDSCNHIIFSPGEVVSDVFMHEFMHGITKWSSNMVYQGQSGALDESYADFFGCMLDGNWTIGETSGSGASRDLSNPPRFRDPDHMLPGTSGDGLGLRNVLSTNDNGFVHTNSGIPNKVAFLITDGGTHNGIDVTGIGREKAMRLYYDVVTTRLTRTATFTEARNATIAVARDYVAQGKHGFNNRNVCSIIRAYASVGLGASDLDCDGKDDPEDTDDDGDYIPDWQDKCPTIKNPEQEDADNDGVGDVCDNDDDNDGRPDGADNCIGTSNADQSDRDGDGVGDACDNCPDFVEIFPTDRGPRRYRDPDQTDTDRDGMGDICDNDDDNDGLSDIIDNCPKSKNPEQTDRDGDGIGYVCDWDEQKMFKLQVARAINLFVIDPCTSCPEDYRNPYLTRINVRLPSWAGGQIVNERGESVARAQMVAEGDGWNDWSFDFKTDPSQLYRFPAGVAKNVAGLNVSNGRPQLEASHYFFQLARRDSEAPPLSRVNLNLQVQHVPAGQ